MSLLPGATPPEIVKTRSKAADRLDALLVIVPETSAKELFRQLPENERWQELNARTPPRTGTVRTTVLTNRRQTLAVLGYIGADATTFERLSLAGRMFKEASARNPGSVGMEALLAGGFAGAFQMPAYRARSEAESGIRRLVLLDSPKVDIPYAVAA